MLLTLSWAISMWVARCDLDENGRSIDRTFTRKGSWTQTGVTVADETPTNAILMMVTALSYLIIQGIAFNYIGDDDSHQAKSHEKGFALATLIVCMIMFVVYSVFQVLNTKLQQRRIEQAKEDARQEQMQGQWDMVVTLAMIRGRGGKPTERTSLIGVTNPGEESHEPKPEMDVSRFFGKWKKKALEAEDPEQAEEEEKEEEDDGLSAGQIALKSGVMLFLGVALVCFFSDPMVGVITRIGDELSIDAFYVSFVVTPVCSNASELISSLVFASKKSQKSSTITFCQLLGAACMNNTLGLGVLVALVYFRNLAWMFSAETLCILVTIAGVGVVALKRTYKSFSLFFIGMLYFVAIGVVIFFENVFNWH
jgi:Ca2+/H+ antiporter